MFSPMESSGNRIRRGNLSKRDPGSRMLAALRMPCGLSGLVSWQSHAILARQFNLFMGKGDKKSKKGKIWKGSYGVSRNKKAIKVRLKRLRSRPAAPAVEKPKAKRSPRKKETAAE
jgi:ribosomal small subunit protein bTHX